MQTISSVLKQLSAEVEAGMPPKLGICDYITDNLESGEERALWYNLQSGAFKSWPKYSLRVSFPVPSPDKHTSAADAYLQTEDYAFFVGEYGALRKELLCHLIHYFEAKGL